MIDRTPEKSELYECLHEVAYTKDGCIDRRLLSRWIKRNVGKIVNGKRFEQDTVFKSNVAKYFVSPILSPSALQLSDLSDSNIFLDHDNESDKLEQSRISRINRIDSPAIPKLLGEEKKIGTLLI